MPKSPRLQPPTKGVASGTPFVDTHESFTALEGERNVRTQDRDGVGRVSTRPGFQKQFALQMGTAASRRVQGLKTISRASANTSYALGAKTVISVANAIGRAAGLVDLNVAVLNPATQGLRGTFKVFGSASQSRMKRGGSLATINLPEATDFPTSIAPAWACTHPAGTLAAVGFNFTAASNQVRTLVLFIEPSTGNYAGVKLLAPVSESPVDPQNHPVLGACFTANALWMARGTRLWYVPVKTFAGRTVMVDPAGTKATLSTVDPDRTLAAASRITALATYTLGGKTRVWAAFDGEGSGGAHQTPDGTITAGTIAKHFRAGLFLLEETPDTAADTYRLATVVLPTSAPVVGDAYAEVASGQPVQHWSIRLSQWLTRAPRGGLPTALCADPVDGSVYVSFTNQGWGPSASFAPNGSAPYTTIAKFDTTGDLLWEQDTASAIGSEAGGKLAGVGTTYPTDIPNEDGGNIGTTDRDGPAIRALACNGAGSLYAGGRINGGRYNVFGLNSADGSLRWQNRTESNNPTSGTPVWAGVGAANRGVCRNGLAVDPTDAQLLIAAARNDTWKDVDGATHPSPWAMIFKATGTTGTIQWGMATTQDDVEFTPAIPTCITAGTNGVVYGCPIFTDT